MSRGFADQIHIDRIREALWSRAVHGRAAVMVGAGFSRNARPISPSAPAFPTWGKLATLLVEALDPAKLTGLRGSDELVQELLTSSALRRRLHALALRRDELVQELLTGNALQLAREYEAAFSRDALERLLIAAIPDAGHEPGPLHGRLLGLPWADVFTTNYDTLLERAAVRVVDRKYDVVRHAAEIPGTARPRIIKLHGSFLHGSFPSTRPFIITEEDFRTYPRRFAPLVNLVQQSMMENVFCLIGFSGDDPNFLAWTGWVRDNLGVAAPQIYLCGLLELSSAGRDLLRSRNVVPIDLAPLVPCALFPETASRHTLALEWLLGNLEEEGRRPGPRRWPRPMDRPRVNPAEGLAEFPPAKYPPFAPEKPSPPNPVDGDRIDQEIEAWTTNRRLYPGWIVAPEVNRESVVFHTKHWRKPILDYLDSINIDRRIVWLDELNWRLDLCLLPLFENETAAIERILGGINPFPVLKLGLPADAVQPGGDIGQNWDWASIRNAWIELSFARLRAAREHQDVAAFDRWTSRLEAIGAQRLGLHSRLRYEQCLMGLSRLDYSAVRLRLSEWPIRDDDDPFWYIRRAAVHAEIGETGEAERLADLGLEAIRTRTRPGDDDLFLLSREAWAMDLLLRGLKYARWLESKMEKKSSQPAFEPETREGRRDKLALLGCNPELELRLLELRLERASGRVVSEGETRPAPVPGSFEWYEDIAPARQLIRLVEEVAYPPRCVWVGMSMDVLLKAAKRLEADSPPLKFSLLLRISSEEEIEEFFSRYVVASLPIEQVQALNDLLSAAFDHASSILTSTASMVGTGPKLIAAGQIRIAMKLLSRLALRLEPGQLEQALDRAISSYHSPAFQRSIALAGGLRTYFQGILQAMSRRALGAHLLQLVALPIPGADFEVAHLGYWVEPIVYIPDDLQVPPRDADEPSWSRSFERLLELAASERHDVRRRAIRRLYALYRIGLLDGDKPQRFGRVIWARRDEDTGLPMSLVLFIPQLLSCPEASRGQSLRAVRHYCLKYDFEATANGLERCLWAVTYASPPVQVRSRKRGTRYITWSEKELEVFLARIEAWWEQESSKWPSSPVCFSFDKTNLEILRPIYDFLRIALIPHCEPTSPLADRSIALIARFESQDLPTELIRPFLIKFRPESREDAVARIRRGLASRDGERVHSSLAGLYLWSTSFASLGIEPPPETLLLELGILVGCRLPSSLDRTILYAKQIVEEAPDLVSSSVANQLELGLGFLLDETRCRSKEDASSTPIPYDLVPRCRELCAGLAAALARTAYGGSDIIRRWLDEARVDPLPEVRRGVDRDL